MKRIPKSFQIAGHTINVIQKPDLMETHRCYGLFNPDQLCIVLQKPGRKVRREVILQTYWHEVMHAIFLVLGRNKLYADEALVESCGQLIHQILHSAKY